MIGRSKGAMGEQARSSPSSYYLGNFIAKEKEFFRAEKSLILGRGEL
jgi:hypothetical protein